MRRKLPRLPKYRINAISKWSLLVIALFFDGLQLISKILIFIGVGLALEVAIPALISICAYLTLWLMFQLKGVGIFKGSHMGQRFNLTLFTLVIESLPLLNTIPSIAFWTYRMITLTRREDDAARDKIKKQLHQIELEEMRSLQMQQLAHYDATR